MDVLSGQPRDLPMMHMIDRKENDALDRSNDFLTGIADKTGRVHEAVDVAKVIWRWTLALQRIQKQSLHLVNSLLAIM